jgi:hypothetical protein
VPSYALMVNCWSEEPESRPSFDECVACLSAVIAAEVKVTGNVVDKVGDVCDYLEVRDEPFEHLVGQLHQLPATELVMIHTRTGDGLLSPRYSNEPTMINFQLNMHQLDDVATTNVPGSGFLQQNDIKGPGGDRPFTLGHLPPPSPAVNNKRHATANTVVVECASNAATAQYSNRTNDEAPFSSSVPLPTYNDGYLVPDVAAANQDIDIRLLAVISSPTDGGESAEVFRDNRNIESTDNRHLYRNWANNTSGGESGNSNHVVQLRTPSGYLSPVDGYLRLAEACSIVCNE